MTNAVLAASLTALVDPLQRNSGGRLIRVETTPLAANL
jgi:hypothetical protein